MYTITRIILAVFIAGCNYGGPDENGDERVPTLDPATPEIGATDQTIPIFDELELEEVTNDAPDVRVDPPEIQDFIGPSTADHTPWHITTARVCPYLLVDNATVQPSRASILFPDGSERVVPTGDGRSPCAVVPAGGPYVVSLVDGCGGRLVIPASGRYTEMLRERQRRAFRFECYVRIGAGP